MATAPGDEASSTRMRLGEWLRTERLRRGFSYAEVERETRINRSYLQALEDEHYDVLPAPVYTRGFLRLYAQLLGLDPEAAVAMLPERLPTPPGLEPSAALRRPSKDAPAIALPRLPSMRVPSLRIPELRTPRRGLRLGRGQAGGGEREARRPAGSSGGGDRTALPRRRLGLRLGPELRQWALAGAGAGLLVLAAVYVPRTLADDPPGGAGAQLTATVTATVTAATAQATVEAPQRQPAETGGAGAAAGAPPAAGGTPVANLVGLQMEDARRQLEEAGLTSVVVEIASQTAPQGEVVGQSPTAGTGMQRGDNVTLIVSRGAPRG